ncbi:MAG: FixH family protein, partial [Alphaproteobacteria bacterium]|nr:FixH family protein [Alphaproteobacteria bacterium]
MTAGTTDARQWTGRGVILAFVVFFLLLIGAQAAFITIAVSTHTGLVSQQPYRKGLNYGDRIAQSDKQKKLGWQDAWALADNNQRLVFTLTDGNGQHISGLKLSGSMGRPVHKNDDAVLVFRSNEAGGYQADLPKGLKGAFIVDIKA